MTALRLAEKERELKDYQSETIKVIRGQSNLSRELLNTLVGDAERERGDLLDAVEAARQELQDCLDSSTTEQEEFKRLKSWADLYDSCSFAAKKMIVHQFIKSVHVYKNYTMEVEFNVSFEEFRILAAECEEPDPGQQPTVYITA